MHIDHPALPKSIAPGARVKIASTSEPGRKRAVWVGFEKTNMRRVTSAWAQGQQ